VIAVSQDDSRDGTGRGARDALRSVKKVPRREM